MNQDDLFSEITTKVLDYQMGDVLLLSDLSDLVSQLKDFFLEHDEAYELILKSIDWIHQELKQSSPPNFLDNLTTALDLLQSYSQAVPTERGEINLRIKKMLEPIEPGSENARGGICDDDESLQIFMSEVVDRISQAQTTILNLEKDMGNEEFIHSLFRTFHTIKGECGFLKIASLGELAHNVENLLDMLRSKKITPTPAIIDLLLEGLDRAREIVQKIQVKDYVVFNNVNMQPYFDSLAKVAAQSRSNLGDILVQQGKLKESEVNQILQKQKESAFTRKFGEIAVTEKYLSSDELQETLQTQKETQAAPGMVKTENTDPIIKVRVSKVNFLVDMIGELLITLGQMSDNSATLAQLRKITRSLQFGAMELRTETVQSLFSNVKRLVRDVSKKINKNVSLVTIGEDLEIDRNLIEKLEEPLLHLVRNSLDHGLETDEDRVLAGKTVPGVITLQAERRGNTIVITVSDDGHGLVRERILTKAIEKGLVSPEASAIMTDAQVNQLIFHTGFSTKEDINFLSGRGVGMDIVKSVVTANRGRIEIETQPGQFTKFHLSFPLSTAIIDGMITRVAENILIFPIASVLESIKILPENLSTINGHVEVTDLRGEALLVLRLNRVLGLDEPPADSVRIGMVVENVERRKFVFLVDEVISKREVVIKSLGSRFNDMKGISSATVLSGGKIGLVLDVDQIVELSLLEASVE